MEIQLPPGVTRGASPADRSGRWYDSDGVRWVDGKLTPIGGWQRMTSTPLPSTARKLLWYRDDSDIQRLAAGCDNKLLIVEGNSVFDVSPADFTGLEDMTIPNGWGTGLWSEAEFGTPRAVGDVSLIRAPVFSLDSWDSGIMLALSSTDGRLLKIDPLNVSAPATVVPNVPLARAFVTTPERHVLLIGGENPRRVMWGSRETFDFNFASTTNTAGFLDLATEGLLMGLTEVRGGILVFSDCDVWMMQFIGDPYIYNAQRVGSSTSLLSPNAVASVNGMAVWMGKSGFWQHDGGNCRPMPSDVSAAIFDDIDPVYGPLKAHCSVNGLFHEVWWFYPSKDSPDGECDKMVCWNYAEGWWSLSSLSRTAMTSAGTYFKPTAVGVDGHLYRHEDGWSNAGALRDVWVESSSFGSGNQIALLRAEMDSGHGYDATSLTVKVRPRRDAADIVTTHTPSADGLTRLRVGGRDVRVRISSTKSQNWSIGKMVVDVVEIGKR